MLGIARALAPKTTDSSLQDDPADAFFAPARLNRKTAKRCFEGTSWIVGHSSPIAESTA